jgi:hypothetical protein
MLGRGGMGDATVKNSTIFRWYHNTGNQCSQTANAPRARQRISALFFCTTGAGMVQAKMKISG